MISAFNNLNIVNQGGNKIQHPTSGYSNTISQNVEGMNKEFAGFHKNMKNLVMLYKTRHQLMESLNENGLYTAKCYNEMFDDTPLSAIVTPKGKHKTVREDKGKSDVVVATAEPILLEHSTSASFEESEFVTNRAALEPATSFREMLASAPPEDDIEPTEYPESGVIREKLDPIEGSMIAQSNNIHSKEPEGLKASRTMSVYAANKSQVAGVITDVAEGEEKGTNSTTKDPPSDKSITSPDKSITSPRNSITGFQYDQKGSTDPPSRRMFPDDETEVSVESNHHKNEDGSSKAANTMEGSINVVIVDNDDDSFTDGRCSTGEKNDSKEIVVNEEDEVKESVAEEAMDKLKGFVTALEHGVEGAIHGVKGIVKTDVEIMKKKDVDKDEFEHVPFSVVSHPEPESGNRKSDEDTLSIETNSDEDSKGRDDKEYLNISNDGELVVMKGSPERSYQPAEPPSKPLTVECSYFDIHKAAYKETNSKLKEHSKLVEYVVDWDHIVTKRVSTKYAEYAKMRNNLNHYTRKVDSLLAEEEKLRERQRQMKPKQIEKLERNQDKLTGARETHDSAGESLLTLMEEVILRSWRDAFPLLKKSIMFEGDFAAIYQKHMAELGQSLEILDVIGEKEKVSMDGRLEVLENMNPEDIDSGSLFKYSAEKKE